MRLLIEELIEASGLKNEYIAEKVGVDVRTLYKWRKGETMPRLDKAVKLAEVLDVEVMELYTLEK